MVAVKIESLHYGEFFVLISRIEYLDCLFFEMSKYDFCKYLTSYNLNCGNAGEWFETDIRPKYKVYDSLYDFVKVNIVQPSHPELFDEVRNENTKK